MFAQSVVQWLLQEVCEWYVLAEATGEQGMSSSAGVGMLPAAAAAAVAATMEAERQPQQEELAGRYDWA